MSLASVVRPAGLATRFRPALACYGHRFAVPGRRYESSASSQRKLDLGFVFDIDGVLLNSSKPLPGASESLSLLVKEKIPFLFLTNGGGQTELERIERLNDLLSLQLDVSRIVQSHTPFKELVKGFDRQRPLENKTVLVVGGAGDKCRRVAHEYGFKNVVTPGDIFKSHPAIWPFSTAFNSYYDTITKPLPTPVDSDPTKSLKIDAILVFNDPRDWALDIQIITDILLSHKGIIGTYSDNNCKSDLPNNGFQQDDQPPLYFSNPDLVWAATYPQPRLGQGGFIAALEGTWKALTGGAELKKTIIGKPHQYTYEYAEQRLLKQRQAMTGVPRHEPLQSVYMIGDNPASDIQGANNYHSPWGSTWNSILVRSGVYAGGKPDYTPTTIVDGVKEGVEWGLNKSGWRA
ncbi:hypothetical protein KEM56_002450 [Ascosphaera pollenicola]|nr:hypothetical protein KEM56_002450 [Ascosphaera pollenicola]